MALHRTRQARDRRRARQFRLERLTEAVGRLQALIEANPPEPRYGGSGGTGSRSGDHADPTLQAMLRPDPIEAMLTRADDRVDLAVQLLEDASRDIRAAETIGHKEERVNTVAACIVCAGPCVPRAKSHAGIGPLDPRCYQSLYDATSRGEDPKAWRAKRMQYLAESA